MKPSKKNILKLFFTIICLSSCGFQQQIIESAHLAGSWYPGQTQELNTALQTMDANAEHSFGMQAKSGKIKALIVPHAGYQYSGTIAASAYRLLKGARINRVLILAPSHFVAFNGIAIPQFNQYQIPTDTVSIDTNAINMLKNNQLFQENSAAFNPEHSAEIQLPLIHYFLPHAQVVPLIVGQLSKENIDAAAQALTPLINSQTLVVISSDLTHFGPGFGYTPFTDNILLNVRQLDSTILEKIQQNNRSAYRDIIKQTNATVCGRTPIEILLKMIENGTFGQVITRLVAYGSSAEKSPDLNRLVTYGSLVITQETNNSALNKQEKKSLLRYARDTLTQSFNPTVDPALLKPIMTPTLQEPKGVFVTLYSKKNGTKSLRGCIGRVAAVTPLHKIVAEMTLASAFNDTRFKPVTQEELSNILIEISVLTPPRPINSYNEIILNKHGIILTVGKSSALFLPRVPQEFGMNFEQTLSELSKKAGLAADAWKSKEAKFQIFESIDFEEEK